MHMLWGISCINNHDVMMTSSNGNIFRVTGHLCGEFNGTRWIPHTKASDAKLWCFLWSNKRLSKQWWGWLFETLSSPFWRHCNVHIYHLVMTKLTDGKCTHRHQHFTQLDCERRLWITGLWKYSYCITQFFYGIIAKKYCKLQKYNWTKLLTK